MSYKMGSHIFCMEMIKSKNYINKNKERPLINSLIKWEHIVFNEKDMKNNNWHFCNKDKEIVANARRQWNDLKIFDDEIFILE